MPLTVMSYNIGGNGDDYLIDIDSVLRSVRPDAVALLEAMERETVEMLAGNLGMELVYGEANNGYHVAWLSRLPVLHTENHRLPGLAKTLLQIDVNWAGMSVPLFATHLGSRWDGPQPIDEIPVILDVLRPLHDRPHVLVGDFNALRPGDPVGTPPPGVERFGEAVDGAPRPAIPQLLNAGYADCYRARHPSAAGYTYLTTYLWLRIDYIFAAPRLTAHLVDCDIVTGPAAEHGSDHFPVWATFAEPAW